jgi:hypothetical protein
MRNVLDKNCRENQNTHFMFNNFFPKIVPFMRCRKIWKRRGHKWRHNMAPTLCMLVRQGYMHACACTHTHRPISNTYCFSTATMIREHASILRYTYIVYLVASNFLPGLNDTGDHGSLYVRYHPRPAKDVNIASSLDLTLLQLGSSESLWTNINLP